MYILPVLSIYNWSIGCVRTLNWYFFVLFSDIPSDIESISISVHNYSKRFIDKEIGKPIGKLFHLNEKYSPVNTYTLL